MGRFITPIVESVGPGPSVMAPGDGLEGNYHAFLNSVPANGKCLVVVPGLDPLHHLEATCPSNAAGSIGDPVLVNVDDDKQLWVVTGKTHTTEINGVTVPLTGSAWITPTLINSFAAGASSTPQYLKDPLGFVHLRGSVTTGASGAVAFVLPVGYRPGVSDYYVALQSAGAAGAHVHIDTAGNVLVTYGGIQCWFPSIHFLAEN